MNSDMPALGLRQASLSLVRYDPRWAELFQEEAALISKELPDVIFDINHIGSTSVPGLLAKPILDIAIRSNDEELIAAALSRLGYIDRGIRSGRLFIRLRDGDIRTHNLHLYQPDDFDCRDQITFRDALRSNSNLRDQYAALKQKLAKELGDQGRGQYAGRKTDFVSAAISAHRT
ncbi:GrpB family protein [Primorskyibacter sedentarius]|uniref:GrpB family protein n=1 Tax=Primorskyibacter sedentarius TaxID=745311 RepID=UPI001049C2C7|nr:GrpB family protein [Primorskyibacter sedentarius]